MSRVLYNIICNTTLKISASQWTLYMWLESLDYRHHKIWVNNGSAHYNDDGTVTVQVGGPDHPNRLETCDHRRGAMLWRWTGAKIHPTPKIDVLKE